MLFKPSVLVETSKVKEIFVLLSARATFSIQVLDQA